MKILKADAERKNVPTDLYREEDGFRKEMQLQDENLIGSCLYIDKFLEIELMMNML